MGRRRWLWLIVIACVNAWACDQSMDDDVAADDDASDDDATDDDSAGDDDDAADDDSADDVDAGIAHAVMVVHLDPGNPSVDPNSGLINPERPMAYLPTLVDLVELADGGGHKLTLMFTGQWASFVQQPVCPVPDDGDGDDPYEYLGTEYGDCLSLIRAFEAHGHEIAMHHHPFDAPAAWDGFTDLETWQADRDLDGVDETYFADGGGPSGPDPYYLGTTEDLMALVDGIPAGGAGQVISATTEEFPILIRNVVSGGPEPYVDGASPSDLVSQPCTADFDGHWVWQIRMRTYTNAQVHQDVQIDELPAALADHATAPGGPWTVAFVTHAKDVFDEGLPQYAALMDLLAAEGLVFERARDAVDAFPYTATDPDLADPSYACP